jgi:hypothetical protein
MPFRVRHVEQERKFCQQLGLEALERAVPLATVRQTLQEMGTQAKRERKLCMEVIVLLVIAMNLYAQEPIGYVLAKMAQGLRLLWPGTPPPLPGDSALVYRRYQLGVRPLATLFRRLCRPLATQDTPGAFLFGLRLMALDGQVLNVSDTPENAAYFGRTGGSRGESAFPKVQALYLCECGTHALIDAGFWPYGIGEHKGAKRLLRSVNPGMLVMGDRGLYAFDRLIGIRHHHGHALFRLPETVKPPVARRLTDGSKLVWLFPATVRPTHRKDKDRPRLLVRLIEYTICDPALPGHGQRYRLVTTLLDPDTYPAQDLAVAYHERWEIEVALDEVETHLLCAQGPLRSKKPVGVLQELYGALIAHWAIRFVMVEAAQKAGVDPDRLSFTHALRVTGDAMRDFAIAAAEMLPVLYARMLDEIARGLLPPRRARSNPRVVKRKMSNFALKREEHTNLPKLKCSFQEAIVLI